MSVLKVTEVPAEEESKKEEVVAGQVRTNNDGDVILIVNGKKHECLLESDYTEVGDAFLIIFLKTDMPESTYATDNIRGLSSRKYVLEEYPILLDAELTYKEAK